MCSSKEENEHNQALFSAIGIRKESRVLLQEEPTSKTDMDAVLYENAPDETGIVSTSGLSDLDTECKETITMEYRERVEVNGVSNELL